MQRVYVCGSGCGCVFVRANYRFYTTTCFIACESLSHLYARPLMTSTKDIISKDIITYKVLEADSTKILQAPAPAVQQLPEESAASASVPGPETSLDRAAPAVAESPLIPASNLQPEQPTTGVPVALIGDTVSLTPLGGPRADTPSSAPVQHVASTPIESPFSNGVGPSAEATPMDETPAGSAGAGEVVEPESEGVDPPQGSKISWTGQEKFEAVQAILNQNKCASSHAPPSVRCRILGLRVLG